MIDSKYLKCAFSDPNIQTLDLLKKLDESFRFWNPSASDNLNKSLNERYKDEYPIIWYEPNLSSKERRAIIPLLQRNNSLNYFANFQHALASVQKFIELDFGFILLVPTSFQEQNLFRDFQILRKISGFRLSKLEEKFISEKVFGLRDLLNIEPKKAYVFYTRKEFNIEAPADKEEKEVIVMQEIHKIAKEFQEELVIWYDSILNLPSKNDFEISLNVEKGSVFTYNFDALSQKIRLFPDYPYHLILTNEDEARRIIDEFGDSKGLLRILVCSDDAQELQIINNKVIKKRQDLLELVPEIQKVIEQRTKLDLPAFVTASNVDEKQNIYNFHVFLKNLNFHNRKQALNDFCGLANQVHPTKERLTSQFARDCADYQATKILNWYTRISPVNKLMNNCLRIATPDAILCGRLVFKDMEKAIREHYQQEKQKFIGVLYRAAYISQQEWIKFERNQGHEVEMLGFLSTSKNELKVRGWVGDDTEKKALIEIIVPPLLDLDPQGFADLTKISVFPKEEEVLFNVRSRFQVLGTDVIKLSENKECRRVILLFGDPCLVSDKIWNKLSTRIQIKFPSFFQRKCQGCPNQYNLYLNFVKNQIRCRKCISQEDSSEFISLGKISKKRNLKVSNSKKQNLGWNCDDCGELTTEINYKKWSVERKKDLHKNCMNCFKLKKKRKLDISLLAEENPKILFLDDNGEYGLTTFDFQNNFPENPNQVSQGDLFLEVKQYKECLEYCKKKLQKISTKRWREQERLRIYSLIGKSSTYLFLREEAKEDPKPEEFQEYVTLQEQAKEYLFNHFKITESLFGKQHPNTATSSHNVAILHKNLKEDNNALRYFEYALEVTESVYRKKSLKTVQALNTLAVMQMKLGEKDNAVQKLKRAVNILIKMNGERHFNTATGFQNLSDAYQSLGKEEESREYFKKALAASKAISKRKNPSKVALYHLFAAVFLSCETHENFKDEQNVLGQFLRHFQETEKILIEMIPQVKDSQHDLAGIYKILGEIYQGLGHFLEPLDHREIIYAQEKLRSAVLLMSLGKFYEKFGKSWKSLGDSNKASHKFKKVYECFEQALKVRIFMYGEIHKETAATYKNLSSICCILNNKKEACHFGKKAWDIFKQIDEAEKEFINLEEEEKLRGISLSKGFSDRIYSFFKRILRFFSNSPISQQIDPLDNVQMECVYAQKCFEDLKSKKSNNKKDLSTIKIIHTNLAELHGSLKKYQKAFEHAKKALNIEESLNGKSHSETVSFYNKLIRIDHSQYGGKVKLESHLDELKMREFFYDKTNLSSMLSYFNDLALAYEQLKEHPKALYYRKEALQLSVLIYKKEHPETASSYNKIGIMCETLEIYQEALYNYLEALIIIKQVCKVDHLDKVTLYNNLASVKIKLAKYTEAFDYFSRALNANITLKGKDHQSIATSYLNFAKVYGNQGKHEQELESCKRALQISKSIYGEVHLMTAASLNGISIAIANSHFGNFQDAERNQIQALKITNSICGLKHSDLATSYNNLANLYAKHGKIAMALESSKRALEIILSIYKKEHSETAVSFSNLASIYLKCQDHENALKYQKQALRITKLIYEEEHPQTALSYHQTALIFQNKGENEKAFDYFEKALKSCNSNKEYPPSYLATFNRNLALAYLDSGKIQKSLEFFKKALDIRERYFGDVHPETIGLYENLSVVYEALEEYGEALEYMKKANP